MMKLKLLTLSALFMMSFVLPAPTFAQASDSPEFLELMQEGISLYKKGKKDPNLYREAIIKFTEARALSKNPQPIYNIARTYQQLDECEPTLENFYAYQEASKESDGYDIADVSAFVADLERQCGRRAGQITTVCTPADTILTIDGKDPLPCSVITDVRPGQHSVAFSYETTNELGRVVRYDKTSRTLNIREGERTTLVVTMDKKTSHIEKSTVQKISELADSVPAASDTKRTYRMLDPKPLIERPLFITGSVLTFAGMIAGGVGGYLAYRAEDDKDEDTTSTVGLAVAGVGSAIIVSGVTLLIIDALRKKDYSTTSVTPDLIIGPNGGHAGVTITF